MKVINCPSDFHKKLRTHKRWDGSLKEIAPTPRSLITFEEGILGTISVQCKDSPCCSNTKKESGGKFNGWYRIEFNGLGAYKTTPIPVPEKRWELEKVPVAIMEDK
jgi:hypothetical protein